MLSILLDNNSGLWTQFTKVVKCPSLRKDPKIFLDTQAYDEWLLPHVLPDGEWGQVIWDENVLDHRRHLLPDGEWSISKANKRFLQGREDGLILARYWCELVVVKGYMPRMVLPPMGTNTFFVKECKQLTKVGVPMGLIDMIGDGNCLYYAMIHYLAKVDSRILLTIGNDYPQI